MPSASQELRNWILATFGTMDTAPIIKELEARRFVLTKEWCWQRTTRPTKFEWNCIDYLIEEWDFGGYDED